MPLNLATSSTLIYQDRVPVEIVVQKGPYAGIAKADVKRRAEAMLACLQLKQSILSIVLTDDESIRVLNREYRRKDKPTDVLAFAIREGEFSTFAGELLGDVIISIPTAGKQARARRRPLVDEVTMLLAHGLLHLLGWDHDTAAKDRAMRSQTEVLCEAARVRRARSKGPARAHNRSAQGPKTTAKGSQRAQRARRQS